MEAMGSSVPEGVTYAMAAGAEAMVSSGALRKFSILAPVTASRAWRS